MNIGKTLKSLTMSAAAAVKKGASSEELQTLHRKIQARITEVDEELQSKQRELDYAERDGDLEAVRAIRQAEADLKDEDRVLHRQRSDLHQEIEATKGREGLQNAGKHRGNLKSALEQANKAREMLEDCKIEARKLVQARQDVSQIGQKLIFDAETIQGLVDAIYPEGGQEAKQMKINLGIVDARRAA